MPDALLEALARGSRVFDLGRPLFAGMPQSPNHPSFRMALQRRHGDVVRSDGTSGSNELIVTSAHMGTHIDALAHVSHQGKLHGGVSAGDAVKGGLYAKYGIDTVAPMVCRGVLLDAGVCEPGYEITPADLESARGGLAIDSGDVVLVRTGWGRLWDDAVAYVGHDTGVPGPGEEGTKWLAAFGPRAVGGDTIAFEHVPAGVGLATLPGHRVLLVEHGIHIIEMLDLEELAGAGVREFLFVLSPLKLVGGTGSPVRPLAIVTAPGPGRPGAGAGAGARTGPGPGASGRDFRRPGDGNRGHNDRSDGNRGHNEERRP